MHPQIDLKIIAEWKARTDAHKKRQSHLGHYSVAALIASIVSFWYFKQPLLLVPVPFCLVYILIDWIEERANPDLTCPHCGLSPVGRLDRSSPLSVDYCANCHHWLVNPIGGRSSQG